MTLGNMRANGVRSLLKLKWDPVFFRELCEFISRLMVQPTGPTEEMNRPSAVRDSRQPPLV
jgi:hypothetical protein